MAYRSDATAGEQHRLRWHAIARRLAMALQAPPRSWSRRPPIEASAWLIREFDLYRYDAAQRREILRLIASQPVVAQGDIMAAVERADRRTLWQQRAWLAAAVIALIMAAGLLATAIAHRFHQIATPPAPAMAESSGNSLANTTSYGAGPGGLDAADRAFFADLSAGRLTDTPAGQQAPRTTPRPPAVSVAQSPRMAPPPPLVSAAQHVARTAPATPVPAAPMRAAAESSSQEIQLGAFPDPAMTEKQWRLLATQFPPLRQLTKTVIRAAREDQVFYRLRAHGHAAANACSALIRAKADCFVVAGAVHGRKTAAR